MSVQRKPLFDTAAFEEQLVGAGVTQKNAAAQRRAFADAMAEALDTRPTRQDLELMQSRIETAIANQTVEISKRMNAQFVQFVAIVGALIAAATAIIKLG
ncbi:hypothetical protein [Caulobacter sp. 17J80-11]|uniref:hypothetical protein n=1 Tax=Caulobacter sp. 17J80-11 TaxID=2763502 RepID=UPI0016538FF2|nr:hypothetical protein [Caulobacter sp. 17J80-11]MBC6982088.1 hypothetical protein [Caulobacter sp. 17J80-11]